MDIKNIFIILTLIYSNENQNNNWIISNSFTFNWLW